jgi:hypothetical protein
MSMTRALAAIAVVVALLVLAWRLGRPAAPLPLSVPAVAPRLPEPGAPAEHDAASPARAPAEPPTGAPAPAPPALPDEPPFGAHDLVVTTDMPEGPVVVLRSSARSGSDLAVELAASEPLPDGRRVFATVSVSDGLGNTIMDCAWRDIELTGGDARKLACELPADVPLPLAISGHQRPTPSFVEAPVVVAIDPGVRR